MIDIEKWSIIAFSKNQRVMFYFQINEDKLAKYFLVKNEILKDGSIYDNCKDEAF